MDKTGQKKTAILNFHQKQMKNLQHHNDNAGERKCMQKCPQIWNIYIYKSQQKKASMRPPLQKHAKFSAKIVME